MNDDASLLRRFAEQRAEDAFAELVRRHLNLVYFAALRQTNSDSHHAEDAAQATFTLLAQKAGSLLNHPNLAGWLHTTACNQARELIRAEHRRLQREQAAHVMHELTSAEANDAAWMQIRSVIDDALQDLPADDREAVLLRYFENRSYSEIGNSLRLGENAARMRVNRALEQLETALARRGVKSTAAALATAFAVPAALAAPTNLGVTITTTALAATAAVGTTATAFTVLKIMSSAKLIATATTLVALAALGTALYQNQQQTSLKTQLTKLESRLAAEKKRADDAETDNDKFLAATASMIMDKKAAKPSDSVIDHDSVQARYDKAKQLDSEGRYEEALADYLWCFDTGMPHVSSYKGVRVSFLLHAIAELGTKYPPALDALRERRDKAQQQFLADSKDKNAIADFSRLNQYLGEQDKSLEVFNSLAPDDKRRSILAYDVKDQLLEAKRYNEFVSAYPYKSIAQQFDAITDPEHMAKAPSRDNTRLKQFAARSAADDIEALAGSGDLSHASEFITKVLSIDNSAETIAIIQVHLARAGHSELLKAQ